MARERVLPSNGTRPHADIEHGLRVVVMSVVTAILAAAGLAVGLTQLLTT